MSPTDAPDALPRTTALLNEGIARGVHIGAQVFVALRGQTLADFAIGAARPGTPMSPDTLTLWLSACKPIGAMAIAQLTERASLALDDRVADVIPEFAVNRKEAITVRHLLTHTAGLRWVETGWPITSWEQIVTKVCATRLEANWEPGRRARYDATVSWYVLGEIVQRIDGRPYEQYVRDEIFVPLGMGDSWIGMPAQRMRAYGDKRLGVLYMTDKQPIRPLPPYDLPEAYTHCRPAANGRGPVRELGRLYQMLLNDGTLDGVRLLRPETVQAFTSPQRVGLFDESFRHNIDWGLGFLVDSRRYGYESLPYSFGPYASDRTFGHHGFQSSMALADPAHGLVVVIGPNGTPGEAAHDARLRGVLAAVYEDAGLA